MVFIFASSSILSLLISPPERLLKKMAVPHIDIFKVRAVPSFRFCMIGFIWQSRFVIRCDVAGEFGFDFLDAGEAALEFRRDSLGELGFPIRDGDGLLKAAQCILDEQFVFPLA